MNSETRRKLLELGMSDLITAYDIQMNEPLVYEGLPLEERFQIMIDYLYNAKMDASIQALLKRSRMRQPNAELTRIVYEAEGRHLNRTEVLELAHGQYIHDARNVIIEGPTGSGKTYMACVLIREACKQRNRSRYIRFSDLLDEYDMTVQKSVEGRRKMLKRYTGYKVLVIDEWLMQEITESQENFLFTLTDMREGTGSTILCTQYKSTEWVDLLGSSVQAEAIHSRLTSNATIIKIGETDMRDYVTKQGLRSGL